MSVSPSYFVESGAGQYTAKFNVRSGEGKDNEVKIKVNQIGKFDVNGRVVHYFGDNKKDGEDYPLHLSIQVSEISTTLHQKWL